MHFSGVMPLWILAYSFFFPHLYGDVAFPFYHIAGALGVIACPVLVGAALQRCIPKSLPYMDRAIHPTCLLLTLTAATVASYSIWQVWSLITWPLMAGSCLFSITGCLVGGVSMFAIKRKLSLIKTVSIVTALQNTLLVTIFQQTSYPAPQASIMHTAVVCIEFSSLCLMYLLYVCHLILWTASPSYRHHHDNIGINGVYQSMADKIAKSMIKSGEISFGDNQTQSNTNMQIENGTFAASDESFNTPPTSSMATNSQPTTASHGLGTVGIKNRIFSTSFESMRRLSRDVAYPLNHESLSDESSTMSYFGGIGRAVNVDYDEGESSDMSSGQVKRSETDSLSIDYDMLNNRMNSADDRICEVQSDKEVQSQLGNHTTNTSGISIKTPSCELNSDSNTIIPNIPNDVMASVH